MNYILFLLDYLIFKPIHEFFILLIYSIDFVLNLHVDDTIQMILLLLYTLLNMI